MSDPISGTGLTGGALTGASVYGLLTGTDYGVVFGAFAGAVFYIATAADLGAARRMAYFVVSYIAGILCSGWWVRSWLTGLDTAINLWTPLVPLLFLH